MGNGGGGGGGGRGIGNDFLLPIALLSPTMFSLLEFNESLLSDVSYCLGFGEPLLSELPFLWCFEVLSTMEAGGGGGGGGGAGGWDVEARPFLWCFEILSIIEAVGGGGGGGGAGGGEGEECTFLLDLSARERGDGSESLFLCLESFL